MTSQCKNDTKMSMLKSVDHWAGGTLCVFLSLTERCLNFMRCAGRPFVFDEKVPGSVLVIKFFGMGSILLISNLVRSIRGKYPNARITFLTFKENVRLLELLKITDEIRVIDTTTFFSILRSVLSNLLYFSFHKPDIAIDLEFFSKFSTMMAFLSGAKWRVGFHLNRFWRNALVNLPFHFNYSIHILDIYRLAGKTIGIDVPSVLPPAIPLSDEIKEALNQMLLSKGIGKGAFLLGVNVNASDLAYCRRWPLEKYAAVINTILNANPAVIVCLTGTRNESCFVAKLHPFIDKKIADRVIDFSGELSFEGFIALINTIDVFLTNDSGPFHIAQMQRTPSVSIWGAGDPALYGTYGETTRLHKIIYRKWLCSPCLYIYRTDAGFFCQGQAPCLNDILSREVAAAVQSVINNPLKRSG